MTIGSALRGATERLDPVSDSARFDAWLLLEAACGASSARILAHPEDELGAEAASRYESYLARRARGEPVAYITGSVGFYGRSFRVDRRVLIPRPETEHLVEGALDHLRALRASGARRLRAADVGTGSGAIAISLAAELDGLEVFAGDLSPDALALATQNAAALGVGDRVRFATGDLLEPLRAYGPFACIVANLPYVPSAEVPARPNPVGFEPRLALDGGADGLALYRRLLAAAGACCAPGGALFLEAAPGTIAALAALVEAALPAAAIEIGTDYGGDERYVSAKVAQRTARY